MVNHKELINVLELASALSAPGGIGVDGAGNLPPGLQFDASSSPLSLPAVSSASLSCLPSPERTVVSSSSDFSAADATALRAARPSASIASNGTKAPPHKASASLKPGVGGGAKKRTWKKPADKPKRPLSAYNLFFQSERKKIVADVEATLAEEDDFPAPPRKHRLSYGKIGFAALAQTVSSRWKSLDATSRSPFEKQASIEKARYAKELEAWKSVQKVKAERAKAEEEARAKDKQRAAADAAGAALCKIEKVKGARGKKRQQSQQQQRAQVKRYQADAPAAGSPPPSPPMPDSLLSMMNFEPTPLPATFKTAPPSTKMDPPNFGSFLDPPSFIAFPEGNVGGGGGVLQGTVPGELWSLPPCPSGGAPLPPPRRLPHLPPQWCAAEASPASALVVRPRPAAKALKTIPKALTRHPSTGPASVGNLLRSLEHLDADADDDFLQFLSAFESE